MNAMEILTRIRASGLTLRPSGDRLVVDSSKPLTEPQRQFIRQHKAAILQALAATAPANDAPATPSSAATEPEPNRAEANRQAMTHIAGVVDQFRQVFGADQVRVIYAEENGRQIGRQEAEPKAGTCYHCRHWCGTKSGNGYCVVGFAPPVQRQADDTRKHFTPPVGHASTRQHDRRQDVAAPGNGGHPQTVQPAVHCHGCARWRPEKAGCADRFGVIRDPATPPCQGADFEPKEGRS